MKALTKLNTTVTGNKFTITGELVDVQFPAVVAQRHNTVHHTVLGHPSKPRHLQSNSHGFLILRNGSDGVLFPKDEMASIAIAIDPKLTDVPTFIVNPTAENPAGKVVSEIEVTAKIQQSDDGEEWTDAPDDTKPIAGKRYRCVAKNANGETVSSSFNIRLPKPEVKK